MAELFRHTDEDGDTVVVQTEAGDECTVNIYHSDEPYPRTCVYFDRTAALELAAALVSFYSPKDLTKGEEACLTTR